MILVQCSKGLTSLERERFYGLKALLLSSRPLHTHTAAVLSGENYNCSETNNLITELSEVAQGLHAAESSR